MNLLLNPDPIQHSSISLPPRPQKPEAPREELGAESSKALVLLEALQYLQNFSGKKFVVKYGGSFMDSEDLETRSSVARSVVFLQQAQIKPIIVHGGGKAISRALERAGIQSKFIGGERVTDHSAVSVVEDVLSKQINPEIVQMVHKFGGRARGFSGADTFTCEKRVKTLADGREIDLGFVGEIVDVNIGPILECISQGLIPIVSPTARDCDGQLYNCNADLAAASVARYLKAERLVFMSDVPGVMRDLNKIETLIHEIRLPDVTRLVEEKVLTGGMLPKVEAACAAIRAGVGSVSFIDGRLPHALLLDIFTDRGVGTIFRP